MPHKTIHHVLTHRGGETSLASCLAARDNRPPVPCCCPCMCLYTCVPLTPCANVRREEGLCLWGEMAVLSHSFPLTHRVLVHATNVIWRCCTDHSLLQGGNSLCTPVAHRFGCSGKLATVTAASLCSKDTQLLSLNDAQEISDSLRDATEKFIQS